MSRVSTFAGSSFSPERMLRSTTAPVSRFLNLVRVNAAPLPGFTNWNSMTVYGFPSISTLRPLRISDVSYMTRHVYLAHSGPVKPRFYAARRQHRCQHAELAAGLTLGDKHRDGRCGTLSPPARTRAGGVPCCGGPRCAPALP